MSVCLSSVCLSVCLPVCLPVCLSACLSVCSVEEQEGSRLEMESCDQYSMAAEKDSGRSDVSDMGSDSVSLADDDQDTPPGGQAHRTLRSAALSLKLLHDQEADQHSARLFVQSLATLMPRLLALRDPSQLDLLLQNSSSSFCSGLQAGENLENLPIEPPYRTFIQPPL